MNKYTGKFDEDMLILIDVLDNIVNEVFDKELENLSKINYDPVEHMKFIYLPFQILCINRIQYLTSNFKENGINNKGKKHIYKHIENDLTDYYHLVKKLLR